VFALATAVLPSVDRMTERSWLPDLHLQLLPATAKQHRWVERVTLPLPEANPALEVAD